MRIEFISLEATYHFEESELNSNLPFYSKRKKSRSFQKLKNRIQHKDSDFDFDTPSRQTLLQVDLHESPDPQESQDSRKDSFELPHNVPVKGLSYTPLLSTFGIILFVLSILMLRIWSKKKSPTKIGITNHKYSKILKSSNNISNSRCDYNVIPLLNKVENPVYDKLRNSYMY